MSNEIMQRVTGVYVTPTTSRGRSRRQRAELEQHVAYAVDQEGAVGIVKAARAQADAYAANTRVEAAAFVAQVGMARVAALSAEEGRLIAQVPLAEPRLKAVADTYAGLVASELAKLAMQ